jgi:hypothetical protein
LAAGNKFPLSGFTPLPPVPPAHPKTGKVEISSEEPLVSCIMPTCDRLQFVPEAVRGFLKQDYPNLELVIVDDGVNLDQHFILPRFSGWPGLALPIPKRWSPVGWGQFAGLSQIVVGQPSFSGNPSG